MSYNIQTGIMSCLYKSPSHSTLYFMYVYVRLFLVLFIFKEFIEFMIISSSSQISILQQFDCLVSPRS